MRIGVLQFAPEFGDVQGNLDRVQSILEHAEADLWVLPELFQTGYVFESKHELRQLAETIEGPTVRRVSEWAREFDAAIAFGFAECEGDTVFNSGALLGPDGLLSHYRKLHLFDREKLVFAPGNLPLQVAEFRGARVGMMICFDWRFPETARSLAFLGADILVHPSNLVLPWCPEAMRYRSLENHVFAATSNRVGTEKRAGQKLTFIGQSQVTGLRGELLGRLGTDEEGVLVVDVSAAAARDKRAGDLNDLWQDRRPEHYLDAPARGTEKRG